MRGASSYDTLLLCPAEWPTVYSRGTGGLTSEVKGDDKRAKQITLGGLEYIGEWHSHPDGYGATPSTDDKKALRTLSAVMWGGARRPVMFIIAESEYQILVLNRQHSGVQKSESCE